MSDARLNQIVKMEARREGESSPSGEFPGELQTGKRLSLRWNFSWTLAGNVVYGCTMWGLLVVLARLTSPEVVGRFALGFAVTAPAVMFANLQLRSVQSTDAREEYQFGHYLALRLITVALAFAVIAVAVGLSAYGRETALVILVVGVARSCESVSDVYHGLAQQHERMDRIAVSLMIKGPLSLVAFGLAAYLTRNVLWSLVALVAIWLLVLVTYDLATGRNLVSHQREPCTTPIWDWGRLRTLTILAMPLGFTMMLVSLNSNIPRYFTDRYLGEAQLGIFAAMSYVTVAGGAVVTALAQSSVPRLARCYSDADRIGFVGLIWKLLRIGALTAVGLVLVAVFGGKWLLTVLYGPEYALQSSVFVWIAVAAGLAYVQLFLGCGMTAARYFRVQVPVLGSATVATVAACLWLIPIWGLAGAAVAVVVGTAVLTLATLAVVIHAVRGMKARGDWT